MRRSGQTRLQLGAWLAGMLVVSGAMGQTAADPPDERSRNGPAGSHGTDWPGFLGPAGDSKSPETGMATEWRPEGPPLVWHRPLGTGYGIGTVAGGQFYQFDRYEEQARLTCLKAHSGEFLWKFEYPTDYKDQLGYNNGPRCSPVVDEDRVYLYGADGKDYVAQTGFNLAPIDLDAAKLSGAKTKVFVGGTAGAWDDAAKINEGSTLLKVNSTYYYFWSCNAWGYFVGYATATNVWGPYTKNPNNPIWGAAQPRWREAAGQPARLPFTEVGHGTPFLGPDGRLWISGHGHVIQGGAPPPYDSPRLCLDPLSFDIATGEFSSTLSWNPQTISFHPASPAAQRARSEPLGSVLEQYGKP